jgi:hypothetical protein
MPGEVHVYGVDRVLRAFGAVKNNSGKSIAEGLAAAAKTLFNRSQILVPVEKGDLKATGKIESGGRGFGAWAQVVYGGISPTGREVTYALVVHEDLEKYHAPPTQARYLADAVLQTRGTMTARVGRSLRIGLS